MPYNRREVLQLASTLALSGGVLPAFLQRTARAAAEQKTADGRVLVVLQLTGGNDGLNTVVPYTDENYRRLRPTLHLADAKFHKLDDRVGLHPDPGRHGADGDRRARGRRAERGLSTSESLALRVDGHLANRSQRRRAGRWAAGPHRSRLAGPHDRRPGNVGRASPRGAALRIGSGEMPRALLGCRVQIPSLADLDQLKGRAGLLDPAAARRERTAWQASPAGEADPLLAAAIDSGRTVQAIADQIEQIHVSQTGGGYPGNELGRRLRVIAELVKARFPTSIYFTELGGFDTHADQANRHGGLLRTLGDALAAFVDEVQKNAADRPVLVLVFSEFGRRVEENASRGTDHGTAAPIFLVGDGLVPGVHGPYPDLANLVDGDPSSASISARSTPRSWKTGSGLPSEPILGKKFDRLDVLRSASVQRPPPRLRQLLARLRPQQADGDGPEDGLDGGEVAVFGLIENDAGGFGRAKAADQGRVRQVETIKIHVEAGQLDPFDRLARPARPRNR